MRSAATLATAVLVVILLTGCGESASESHQNEKRDETTSAIDQRLNELDARVLVLEKAHEENTK